MTCLAGWPPPAPAVTRRPSTGALTRDAAGQSTTQSPMDWRPWPTRALPQGRGEPLPVPLGDDFDATIGHFDRGLIVNRVRRLRHAGRPFFRLGHRIFR